LKRRGSGRKGVKPGNALLAFSKNKGAPSGLQEFVACTVVLGWYYGYINFVIENLNNPPL
jgi:hypothetical protein